MPREDEGGDPGDVSSGQRPKEFRKQPAIQQKPGARHEGDSPSRPQEEPTFPTLRSTSGLENGEVTHFCCCPRSVTFCRAAPVDEHGVILKVVWDDVRRHIELSTGE